MEPLLYYGHHWDRSKCPDYRGVLISEVVLYTKGTLGLHKVSLFTECPDYYNYILSVV